MKMQILTWGCSAQLGAIFAVNYEKGLPSFPHKIQLMQLRSLDQENYLVFMDTLTDAATQDCTFISKLIMHDKAHFHPNGCQ